MSQPTPVTWSGASSTSLDADVASDWVPLGLAIAVSATLLVQAGASGLSGNLQFQVSNDKGATPPINLPLSFAPVLLGADGEQNVPISIAFPPGFFWIRVYWTVGDDQTGSASDATWNIPAGGQLPGVVLPPSPPPPIGGQLAGVDFGQDILCGITPTGAVDLDPNFGMVTGLNCLAQSLCNRFQTPNGTLPYDLDFGRDLRRLVNAGFTPAQLAAEQSGCEAEAEKDPRVNAAAAVLTFQGEALSGSLQLELEIVTDAGPFKLVLSVTKLSVTILDVNT